MRRIRAAFSLLFLAASCFMAGAYSPTTTWPYIYEEFTEGSVRLLSGVEKNAEFNIHLSGSVLHYIEGDNVKTLNISEVLVIRIGKDIYTNVAGQMLKVLAKSDKCLIVEDTEVDFAILNSTGGAYGTSSNTISSMALTSAEGIGGSNTSTALNHMELKRSKEDGKVLPLIIKNYIFVKGYKIYCAKKDVLEQPVDKDALKVFLKENKIKFNKPESVILLGDFLYDLL